MYTNSQALYIVDYQHVVNDLKFIFCVSYSLYIF